MNDPALLKRIRNDYPWYAEKFIKIKGKDGQIVPFKFNETQKWVQAHVNALEAAGRPVRLIVLKSRQPGISTWSQGYVSHKVFTRKGQHAMCILHKKDEAADIYRKAEFAYDNLPDWLKPPKASKSSGRRLILAAPFHGMLYAETAENRGAGRSGTWQHVHISELPLWPDADDTIPGLMNSVPNEPGTSIIIECTAKGMGNRFHKLWQGACSNRAGEWWNEVNIEPGENGLVPIFLPWWLHHEYTLNDSIESVPVLTKAQREFKSKFKLSDRQTIWYWLKMGEIGEDQIKQDFPCTPDEAFLTSGRPFFHRRAMEHYRDQAKANLPLKIGDFAQDENGVARLVENEHGQVRLYRRPNPGEKFIIGADTATGRAGDYSSAHVVTGNEVVATFRGKVDPDEFAQILHWLALAYNRAMVAPESNGIGYSTIVSLIKTQGYTNVYMPMDEANSDGGSSPKYGWVTSGKSRPMMLELLGELTRTKALQMSDHWTAEEMMTFIFADELGKKAEAQPGCNDDTIISLAIALAVERQYPTKTSSNHTRNPRRPVVSSKTGW